jgi:hypothetical protein
MNPLLRLAPCDDHAARLRLAAAAAFTLENFEVGPGTPARIVGRRQEEPKHA